MQIERFKWRGVADAVLDRFEVSVGGGSRWTFVKLTPGGFDALCGRISTVQDRSRLAPTEHLRRQGYLGRIYGFLTPVQRCMDAQWAFSSLKVETDVFVAQADSSPTKCPWRTAIRWRATSGEESPSIVLEQVYRYAAHMGFSFLPPAEQFFRVLPGLLATQTTEELAMVLYAHLQSLRLKPGAPFEVVHARVREWVYSLEGRE